jgi:hypothetical protein
MDKFEPNFRITNDILIQWKLIINCVTRRESTNRYMKTIKAATIRIHANIKHLHIIQLQNIRR